MGFGLMVVAVGFFDATVIWLLGVWGWGELVF